MPGSHEWFYYSCSSGKTKAHKHESFWPVTPPVRWPGVKDYVLSSEPKEHTSFAPGARPGRPEWPDRVLCARVFRARKKPININILGRTVSGTHRNLPWDKPEPFPGTNRHPSLGQTGGSLLNSTVKSPFCPVVPGTGGGLSLGRLSQKGRKKNVYVFSVYWFFCFQSFRCLFCSLSAIPLLTGSYAFGNLLRNDLFSNGTETKDLETVVSKPWLEIPG